MVPYIDIHCHLDFPQIYPIVDEVIKNAKSAGVNIILTSGVDKSTNRISLELSKKYDIVKPALGFYPPDALHKETGEGNQFSFNFSSFEEELAFIRKNKHNISAISEIGLDYHHGKDKAMQKKVFLALLDLASELDKPVIVHSRKAEEDVITLLEERKQKKVIMHCFSGKKDLVKKAADLGCFFSIPTNVVRAENMQWLVKNVSISKLFAETDSPFLSPFKERQNEPAFVIESYKKITELKGLTLEEVKNNIFMNWQRLF
jgi:TatD DNase family protein